MIVKPIKTPVVHVGDDLYKILDQLPKLEEKTVVVVTCKIVALCEGAVVAKQTGDKEEKRQIVKDQAELYTEPAGMFELMLTVKNQILAVNAGIDESNSDGQYVLFPQDPQKSVNQIWQYLKEKHQLQDLGLVMIDSRSFPLKWGTIGTALAHCGMLALNNRIGEKDLFGKEMEMTQENVVEAFAVAANLEMGEVAEAQPLAVITDVPYVQFQDRPPTEQELNDLQITLEDDVYSPILTKADWKKGGQYQAPNHNKLMDWFKKQQHTGTEV